MKVKGIDRTANVAWSPRHQHPIYLAAGTAAQQLDASFSTTAVLELYALNLNDPGFEMGLRSTTQSEHRFHKLTWGTHGQSSGTIVGGCDGGVIQIYNATKLLNGENGLVSQQNKHNGSVRALDFNSFQSNLLASAASESEIYIWDLNNPTSPMTPGSKCQVSEDIASVAWNKQVQHILASTFSTKCVVWDLRKNDPIIKLTDNTVRIKWNVVAWNPDIATQLCLGSEDDQSPVIQLWDLRFATSPLKVFESHQRGVLSISWCHQDTDMLLSCGRDNKIICWNPNNNQPGSDIICEFISNNQWNFDVSWCPRNPALFACSSFDGHISVYSLVGGPQQVQTSNKIADSFPGMELYTQAPVSHTHSAPVTLLKPPKWLKKPVGAKFGFGGKLVTFENVTSTNHEIPHSRLIHISQVVTEPNLVSRSSQLESTLQSGLYANFCQNKIAQCNTNHEKMIWQFLAANFESSPKTQFLNLLGFNADELSSKLSKVVDKSSKVGVNDVNAITNRMAGLGRSTDSESELDCCDGVIDEQNFLLDDDLVSAEKKVAAFDAAIATAKTSPATNFKISVGDDVDGLICQALLLGDIEAAVDLCLKENRMADAIILAMTGGSELLAKTQYIYFQQNSGYLSNLISAVVTEDWSQVIKNCDIESWKEALAAAITNANDQEYPILCEMLGERLETEKNGVLSKYSELCYICAGNLSKIVASWLKREKVSTPDKIQDLVEVVMILEKAMESQGVRVEISGRLATLLTNYAGLLVSQGSTEAALAYLGDSNDQLIADLRDRLNGSLGRSHKYMQTSKRQVSSHPLPTQKNRGIAAGFYPPQRVQDDVLTAPPAPPPSMSQHNFNLNPLQSNPGSVQSSFPSTPFVPVPPMAPGVPPMPPVAPSSMASGITPSQMAPPPQTVPPPTRAFPSPSPGPGPLTSRSKHVLDPSVQSTPSHSNFYSQTQYQPPIYSQAINSTSSYNATGYPPEAFNLPPANPTPPPPPPPTNIPKIPAMPQPPGWNDPPVVDSGRNFPKTEYVPQNPITHPLFGGPTGDATMNGQMYDPYQSSHMQQQQQQQPVPPPPTMSQMQQSQFQSFPGQQMPYPQSSVSQPSLHNPEPVTQPKQVIPEPVKKPIPEEHASLQKVFDELRVRCMMAANNPQSKRKLEEVSKKLEILYDCLRDGRLSSNTLQGLHLIAQHVQTGDYTNGLMLHTQLVSGPDFSQIASFMPGIKVLLQSALQLQVYL